MAQAYNIAGDYWDNLEWFVDGEWVPAHDLPYDNEWIQEWEYAYEQPRLRYNYLTDRFVWAVIGLLIMFTLAIGLDNQSD